VLADGSKLRVISSRDLIALPIWKGNRVIDLKHVENIKREIGSNVKQLDFGYRIVTYTTQDAIGTPVKESYIVDGQHRARVLKDYYQETLCEPDFEVVVLEKEVEAEYDVIEYFNALNNSKPIKYMDTNLVINRYIAELEKGFNTKRGQAALLIRPKDTRRPYLSVEKVREVLQSRAARLKTGAADIVAFVLRVKKWNQAKVKTAALDALSATKEADMIVAAAKLEFMLAVWPKLPWVDECL
jgi:hypothetical protein